MKYDQTAFDRIALAAVAARRLPYAGGLDASAVILHVEDDPIDVGNLRRALALCGAANPVRAVTNGAEAWGLLHGAEGGHPLRPGIILLDLSMPVQGGLEFLGQLKSEPALRSIPVVVLSASRHDRDLRAAYELGAAGYVVKPIDFDGFVRAIATVERYWALSEIPAGAAR
jgi:CheY-like chemotaxis protein